MRLCLIPLLSCLALLLMAPAPAQADTLVKIVVYGDSLTSGFQIGKEGAYAKRLQEKLERIGFKNFAVIDMSMAVESSAAAYQRVNYILAKQPDIAIVAIGADDAMKQVDTRAINQYVGITIATLLQNSIGVVLLGIDAPPAAPERYRAQLEQVYLNLARHYKTAFVPHALEGVAGVPGNNLADQYRPNGKGVDVMVENTYRTVGAYMNTVLERKKAFDSPLGSGAALPPAQPVPEPK